MSFSRSVRSGLLFLSLAGLVHAQRDLSTIVGVITDPRPLLLARRLSSRKTPPAWSTI